MLHTDNDGDGYGDSYKFIIMLNTLIMMVILISL